jgi:hypothetical protein
MQETSSVRRQGILCATGADVMSVHARALPLWDMVLRGPWSRDEPGGICQRGGTVTMSCPGRGEGRSGMNRYLGLTEHVEISARNPLLPKQPQKMMATSLDRVVHLIAGVLNTSR